MKLLPHDGWVMIDKPVGIGSTKVVSKVKRLFGARKAGHGGTLDPLASGVLPIALHQATKLMPTVAGLPKRYQFTVRWGMKTSSGDLDGDILEQSSVRPEATALADSLGRFTGDILQRPPAVSAIKVDGVRAYRLARAGEPPEMALRPVHIEALSLDSTLGEDEASFTVSCSAGTYVRSLAMDIAAHHGTVGCVVQLRRIDFGPFSLGDAVPLNDLEAMSPQQRATWMKSIVSVARRLPSKVRLIEVSEGASVALRLGQRIEYDGSKAAISGACSDSMAMPEPERILAVRDDEPIALCEIEHHRLRPRRVFTAEIPSAITGK